MKKIFILLLVISFRQAVCQPILWSHTYDLKLNETENALDLEVIPNGYAFVTIQYCGWTPQKSCSNLVLVDTNGVFFYKKEFEDIVIGEITYQSIDSSFICIGEKYVKDSVLGDGYSPIVLKTTFWGDTIWTLTLSSKQSSAKGIVELKDGSFIVISLCDVGPPYYIAVNKIDENGLLTGENYYNHGFNAEAAWGIQPETDSTLIVSYNGQNFPVYDSIWGGIYPKGGFGLMRLDLDGNEIKDSVFLISDMSLNEYNPIIKIGNGLFVTRSLMNNISGGGHPVHFLGIDSLWNIRWATNFRYTHEQSLIWAYAPTQNGGFIGCGKAISEEIGVNDIYPWIFVMDSTGKIIWQRFAFEPLATSYDRFSDIEQTADGGYIVLGVNYEDLGAGLGRAWLLRLDSLGCLQPDCNNYSISLPTTEAINIETDNHLLITPNPVFDKVVISIPARKIPRNSIIEMYDSKGIMVFANKIAVEQDSLSIDLNNYKPGIYLIRAVFSDKSVYFGKIVKVK